MKNIPVESSWKYMPPGRLVYAEKSWFAIFAPSISGARRGETSMHSAQKSSEPAVSATG